MTPFFADPSKRIALLTEAATWVGTPFHPRADVKGKGVDCVSLAAALYRATGLLGKFEPPQYSIEGGMHLDDSIIEDYVRRLPEFQLMPELTWPLARPGDLLLFRIGRIPYHVGVMLGFPMFIQALQRHGVLVSSVMDGTFSARLRAIYRPVTP